MDIYDPIDWISKIPQIMQDDPYTLAFTLLVTALTIFEARRQSQESKGKKMHHEICILKERLARSETELESLKESVRDIKRTVEVKTNIFLKMDEKRHKDQVEIRRDQGKIFEHLIDNK